MKPKKPIDPLSNKRILMIDPRLPGNGFELVDPSKSTRSMLSGAFVTNIGMVKENLEGFRRYKVDWNALKCTRVKK